FNIVLLVILEASSFVYGLSTTSMTVLTASAIGYCIANGIALAAYVKTKRDPKFASLERPFKAPRGWTGVISVMVIVQFFVWLPSLVYWSYYLSSDGGADTGITAYIAIIIAIIILAAYVPIWFMVQKKNNQAGSE
ncbi:MAG: amino acid permease, partial [Candidatus Methanomethylophilaceae archaeon]|nr:amino acid permease [Candidatus Methanomethylophilaceae archaeon]